MQTILNEVMPLDDTAIRFVLGGVGITDNPALKLEELFGRYVTLYSPSSHSNPPVERLPK